MKNEYIELVKQWLADKTSVSFRELRDNTEAASAARDADEYATRSAAAYASYAAYAAYDAAADDAGDAYGADYWVKQYEELTNDK